MPLMPKRTKYRKMQKVEIEVKLQEEHRLQMENMDFKQLAQH